MPKERINVSVDEDVKREITQREDINVSGAVNQFLKRLLMGETTDRATKRIEIQRKKELGEEKVTEGRSLINEAEILEQELQNQQQREREEVKRAIDNIPVVELASLDEPAVKMEQAQLEKLASEVGVSSSALREKAIREFEQTDGDGRGFQ